MSRMEQDTQVKNSRVYNDALAPGVGLETPVAPGDHGEHDFNSLRTMSRYHLTGGVGVRKWYDVPQDQFGLDAIHDKIVLLELAMAVGVADFAIPVGPAATGALVGAAKFAGWGAPATIAVGAGSLSVGGFVAQPEPNFTVAGTLGAGLSRAVDVDAKTLNRVAILDDATDDNPQTTGGEHIFGLLQVINGTADNSAISPNPTENLQISFVYFAKATGVLTATTLPAGTYHFSPIRQQDFYHLPRGFALAGGSLPGLIDPSGPFPKLPFKEWDITAGVNIARGDPFNITTGSFTTAGARTAVVGSYGVMALPASGLLFRDDPRIDAWFNGQNLSKSAVSVVAASVRDVWWVSATQIAFNRVLKGGEVLKLRMPSGY